MPDRPTWDEPGPERRATTIKMVEVAATQAAQAVAKVHRRRLVTWTFLAAMTISLLIMIPVTRAINHQQLAAARGNARFNCAQWKEGAGALKEFIISDAKLRRDQLELSKGITSPLARLIGAAQWRRLMQESHRLDALAQDHWLTDIVPKLEGLSQVNCTATIQTEGPQTVPKP